MTHLYYDTESDSELDDYDGFDDDYRYDSDSLSYEHEEARKRSRDILYNPVETLDPVIKALSELPNGYESIDDVATSKVVKEKGQGDDEKKPKHFSVKRTFPSSEIKVTVENVGELSFPLEEETIQKLIGVSSKAKLGSRTKELLDTKVHSTKMIPASELKVNIKEETMNETIKKMCNSLRINKKCTLKLHLYNMSIYGKGQFFEWHKDNERIDNMIATLVIVLPSNHVGGCLEIKHDLHSYFFTSSEDLDNVRWITFYSDCDHKVHEVSKGYRVALTYNVELQYPADPEPLLASGPDFALNNAVAEHFAHSNSPKRLTLFLIYSYSENSLKWHMMKGRDRTYAQSLRLVAKRQDVVPFLALAKCMEEWEKCEIQGGTTDVSVELHYWVDEQNVKLEKYLQLDYNAMDKEVCNSRYDIWCGRPYKEKTVSSFDRLVMRETLYLKACVVLEKK